MTHNEWFKVDRDGLRELHGEFPPERLVLELIQNAWDEDSKLCEVTITSTGWHGRTATIVTVTDDSPEGFRNLADAYTLFRTTIKRSDPTKRGRFNLGEKIVLARAIEAEITSTKGGVLFDKTGRHSIRVKRASGTRVAVVYARWTNGDLDNALDFLKRLIPPAAVKFTVNGELISTPTPAIIHPTTLATELLKTNEEGLTTMTRTSRATKLELFPVSDRKAMLFEMGIPVCEIEGTHDVNVLQKVPLTQDRTAVSPAYLQDIYAETVKALGETIDVARFGTEIVQLALADDRIDAQTARTVFTKTYGADSVLQSKDPDADQEAARSGMTIVSPYTFGADVNSKLRDGGVPTTLGLFGRDGPSTPANIISPDKYTPEQAKFVGYVQMLADALYESRHFAIQLGRWASSCRWAAFNSGGSNVVFHTGRVNVNNPVSRGTSIIIHELAHCAGNGHDGVYDNEYERLVNRHTEHLARHPEAYRPFEPELFP